MINYIRGCYNNPSIPSMQIRNVDLAFQMHAHGYCVTVSSLDRFLLTDTYIYYIISYSKYLPTTM